MTHLEQPGGSPDLARLWHDESFDGPGIDLIAQVKPQLDPGERLIWAGRPSLRSPRLRRESAGCGWRWTLGFLLPAFGILGVVFSGALRQREMFSDLLVALAILSILLGGMALLSTLVAVLSRRSRSATLNRTTYVLTDRRALIFSPVARSPTVTIHTFARGQINLSLVHREVWPDGWGDLIFRPAVQPEPPVGFFGIENARHVEALVRKHLS